MDYCSRNTTGIFTGIVSGALLMCLNCGALEITPDHVIVYGKVRGRSEVQSPNVLADHLAKVFGKRPRIVKESAYDGKKPAIILKSDRKLDDEEWCIRTSGKNLVIAGGYPRGMHFGVAEFLEKFGGLRWLSPVNIYIPKAKSITVPDGKEFRRKPAFPVQRNLVTTTPGPKENYFMGMNKSNSNSTVGFWPSHYQTSGIGGCHTFWKLSSAVPKNREDLLALNSSGYRDRALNGVGPGQLCYANKEFRQFAKKEIAKWIAERKAFIRKHKLDEKSWLKWIDLSQNDNYSHCVCKGCLAMIKKYGSVSGAQLEFINDIASAFPDYIFQTFAYQRTIKPPKNIKARDNVMMQFAFLSYNNIQCDVLRPLSAPTNAYLLDIYKEWDKVAKYKAVWCYQRLYAMTESFPWPQSCFWYIPGDIRFYDSIGARKLFVETEYRTKYMVAPRAFHDLHVYLTLKMADDPSRDGDALIREFFKLQYGAAEPEMTAYANYLKKRLEAIPGVIGTTPLQSRNCFDVEFFVTINKFLDRAEAKVKNDPERLQNVRIERLPVDFSAAHLWNLYGSKIGMSRKALCDRLEKTMRLAYDRYFFNQHGKKNARVNKMYKDDMDALTMLKNPIPIPKGMEKLDIVQISAMMEDVRKLVSDPDATFGKACKLGKLPPYVRYTHTTQPMEFGIYNSTRKIREIKRVIKPSEVPTDEKYHLYKIGTIKPNGFEKQVFWCHRSWRMFLTRLFAPLWNSTDPNRKYDIYISCKLTGPAYVKGSKSENAVYVDKLVAVKLDNTEEK